MTQSARLAPPSGTGIDELGGSVAVSGSTVAVGAPLETVGPNSGQGAVFVYNEPAAGWSGVLAPAAELTASDGTGDNSFGTVAVSGSTIAVLESSRNPGSSSSVLLFSEPASGWSGHLTESSELVASNEAVTDAFGSGVALSCTAVVVGAPGHHRLGSFAGAQGSAYVFAPPTTTSAAEGRQAAVVPSAAAAPCPLAITFTVLSPQEAGLSYVGAAAKSNTSDQYSQSAAFFREFATPVSAHLLGGGTAARRVPFGLYRRARPGEKQCRSACRRRRPVRQHDADARHLPRRPGLPLRPGDRHHVRTTKPFLRQERFSGPERSEDQ